MIDSVNRQREPEYSAKCIEWADRKHERVAITLLVRLLGRVSTLSCRVVIHGILKHTNTQTRLSNKSLVCFRMPITEEHTTNPSDGLSRNIMRP
jgi:hypothetical protein